MSDERLRQLERLAAHDDPAARAALETERCRRGMHAWTCRDRNGFYIGHDGHITCVHCIAVRGRCATSDRDFACDERGRCRTCWRAWKRDA